MAAAAFLGASRCAESSESDRSVHSPGAAVSERVLCFGDSITRGEALPPGEGSSLWLLTVERRSNGRLRLINEGKNGRSTDSLKGLREALDRHAGEFDSVLIALGANDAHDFSPHAVSRAKARLEALIDAAREASPRRRVIVVGPPNVNVEALSRTMAHASEIARRLPEIDAAFETEAKESGSPYVRLYGLLPDRTLARDGIHPDARGNDVIAEAVLRALLE